MKLSLALLFLAATSMAAADCTALAGESIRWIVPTKPGGGYDAYSRLMQPFIERKLGARIVIENRFEAGGIVGALAIRDAPADGMTIGIINASGLLATNIMANSPAPDPLTEFTILGRVISNHVVMFTGRDSGFSDIDELLRSSLTRPILVGVRDAGSASFFAVPVTASLIGMNFSLVTGYVGNATRALAVIRGEVDIVLHHFDSARRYVDAGELIPLLQLTEPRDGAEDHNPDSALAAVPVLAGSAGLARQRATKTGKTPDQAEREASALASIIGAGRLIVAPPGLPEPLAACLSSVLGEVLTSTDLLVAANRVHLSIAFADRETAYNDLLTGAGEITQFAPLVRTTIDQVRQ
jgi:tripartite-type tricarboxylate transporter receptor subunit TctC